MTSVSPFWTPMRLLAVLGDRADGGAFDSFPLGYVLAATIVRP